MSTFPDACLWITMIIKPLISLKVLILRSIELQNAHNLLCSFFYDKIYMFFYSARKMGKRTPKKALASF